MNDPVLFERFEAWLEPSPSAEDADRAEFFSHGTIILDTNVLLSLYEYTEPSRAEVLSALELAKGRLWMPYQVGLEFVRGRRRTLEDRKRALSTASSELNKKMMAARQAIFDARKIVSEQVEKYSRAPHEVAVLRELTSETAVDKTLAPYRDEFKRCLSTLKKEHGLASGFADAQDPILVQVAQLYGAAVGVRPDDDTLRQRIDDATEFRFPNKIPPGYGDLGKGTPINDAGDFLLWEEVIHYARDLPGSGRRILFVSNDTKEDWYEEASYLRKSRPWPSLIDEMKRRAGGRIRIETPPEFYGGVKDFLNAEFDEDTYAEIERVSDDLDSDPTGPWPVVDENTASHFEPPEGLAIEALHAAGLRSPAVRDAVESSAPSGWIFQWWLIGVTAQLGRRRLTDSGEPIVKILAAARVGSPPSEEWYRGTELPVGEWPYRESSWIAPWFIILLAGTTRGDREVLCGLAAQQAELDRRTRAKS